MAAELQKASRYVLYVAAMRQKASRYILCVESMRQKLADMFCMVQQEENLQFSLVNAGLLRYNEDKEAVSEKKDFYVA